MFGSASDVILYVLQERFCAEVTHRRVMLIGIMCFAIITLVEILYNIL